MYIDGLVQNCSISIANTLGKLESCTRLSMYASLNLGKLMARWIWDIWSNVVIHIITADSLAILCDSTSSDTVTPKFSSCLYF